MYTYLAAILAAQNEQQRQQDKERKRREQIDKENKEKEKYSEYPKMCNCSYIDYVICEMEDELKDDNIQEKLFTFFNKISLEYEKLSFEDITSLTKQEEKIRRKVTEISKQYDIKTEKMKEKFELQQERDIKIHDTDLWRKEYYGAYTYNGLNLSINMLEDESKVPFRKELEKINSNDEEHTLSKKIKVLEKMIKYLPFRKDFYRSLLIEKKAQLEKIQKAKIKVETFECLSPEEKQEILVHLLIQKKYADALNELNNKIDEIRNVKMDMKFNPEIRIKGFQRALRRMLNNNEITKEQLDDVFRRLEIIEIKANNKDNDFYFKKLKTYSRVEMLKDIIKWFIEDVYKEERNFRNGKIWFKRKWGFPYER